jgi:hypothetical protein
MARIAVHSVFAVLLGPLPASAIDVEKLVMPGPVIQGHADIEAECGKCHIPFRSEAQDDLCQDCHSAVAWDLREGRGLHGLDPAVANSRCNDCHTDHQGREADIVALDPESFNHDITEFHLEDAHVRVSCEGCHDAKLKFRDAANECIDCHAAVDAHDGSLGVRCAECHSERAWREVRFDHDATRFPLTWKHRDVECALCHPGDRFENAPTDCQSCHGLNDVHLGRFGSDCRRCHSAAAWKTTRFDHDRDTKFPLRGGHLEAACDSCHGASDAERPPPSDCAACHRADDEHRGRYGVRCDNCHGEFNWKMATFDHERSTGFPLRAAHQSVKCQECHVGTLYEEKLKSECGSCHRDDDVHRGQEGLECGRCHDASKWTKRVFFDHDLGRFPLLGLHAVTSCEQCHLTPRFKNAEIQCVACHESDDVHRSGLGRTCEGCHNPNGWRFWRFDHAAQTTFALRGAHANLDCHVCHRVPIVGNTRLSIACAECHARDDVHFGAFGSDCERCHADDSWTDVEMIQ